MENPTENVRTVHVIRAMSLTPITGCRHANARSEREFVSDRPFLVRCDLVLSSYTGALVIGENVSTGVFFSRPQCGVALTANSYHFSPDVCDLERPS